jgi:hypothetical protein
LLVEEVQVNVSEISSHHDVVLPFHLTVMADGKLDVVYYLLRQFPDALTIRSFLSFATAHDDTRGHSSVIH